MTNRERRALHRKWVKALRSGKYKQTIRTLWCDGGKERAHCCLGVLYNVAKGKDAPRAAGERFSSGTALGDVGGVHRFGLTDGQETELINMNDGLDGTKRRGFRGIAQWIERNLLAAK